MITLRGITWDHRRAIDPLIATLGGITIFGVNGLIIGPVIAAMFLAAWDLFSEQRVAADIAADEVSPPKELVE